MTMKRAWAGLLMWLAALLSTAAQAGTVTYYHNDLAGSPAVATNSSGAVIWRESYRPYGERLTNAPASAANDVWFTSRRQDAETGLVYMGARYYDPMAGRFNSVDPIGFDEANVHSHNRYAYANNNPYRYVDPTGRSPASVFLIEVARQTGAGYALGVAADAISQFAAWGSVDLGLAATSNAATAGGVVGLMGGVLGRVEKATSIAGESATLYRAVSQAEAKQIEKSGSFEAGPNSLSGKWFAETRDHARQWGDALNGKGNSTILEVQVPRSQAEQLMRVDRLDGIGPARYGELDQLRGASIRAAGQ